LRKYLAPSLLLIPVFATLSCGSGSNGRQLQSISISQTVVGSQIQFVATGTYSAPPTTVTPLPADWTLGLMAPPPQQYTYTLTTEPYVFNCSNAGLYALPVVAFAPTDANAPSSGTTKTVVTASMAINCQ
jgi:hypothetical protein